MSSGPWVRDADGNPIADPTRNGTPSERRIGKRMRPHVPPRFNWRDVFVNYDRDDPRQVPECSKDPNSAALFAGDDESQRIAVRNFCSKCPIKYACLAVRIDDPDWYGIGMAMGNMTSKQLGESNAS